MVNGAEGAKIPRELPDDDGLLLRSVGEACFLLLPSQIFGGGGGLPGPAAGAMRQALHEGVLEPGGYSFRPGFSELRREGRRSRFLYHDPDTVLFSHGIEDPGNPCQKRFELAGGPGGDHHMEDMASGLQDEILRPSFPQDLSVIENHDPVEAAGLVHVGGADQEGRFLFPDLVGEDLPEFAPGDRIDPDRRLIQEKKRRSVDEGAG